MLVIRIIKVNGMCETAENCLENQYTSICRRTLIDDREVKIYFLNLGTTWRRKINFMLQHAVLLERKLGGFRTDMNEIVKRKFLPCQEGNASHLNHELLFPAIYSISASLRHVAATRNKYGTAVSFRFGLFSHDKIV